jgi:magnesium transporter
MPELDWQFGYYLVWAVMITATIIMIMYFKRKGWV